MADVCLRRTYMSEHLRRQFRRYCASAWEYIALLSTTIEGRCVIFDDCFTDPDRRRDNGAKVLRLNGKT